MIICMNQMKVMDLPVLDEDEKQQNDDLELFTNNTAKDVAIFREYLLEKTEKPPIDSVTFCGMFNEYQFDTNNKSIKKDLLSPYYYFARNKLTDFMEYDHYISIGIESNISDRDWSQRLNLNLFIVLDVNQSMNKSFNYFERDKSKISVIKKSLIKLLKENLNKMDRFGLILFNDENIEILQPLKFVKDIDLNELEIKINDEINLKGNDTRNLCKGYSTAIALFDEIINDNNNETENRIIFMTDSNPNDCDGDDLIELNKKYSDQYILDNNKQDIYCSFMAVGCDFEDEYVKNIMDCKGCNYFSIHSERECIKIVNDEFECMRPILFDISLQVKPTDDSCIIESIYGVDNNGI